MKHSTVKLDYKMMYCDSVINIKDQIMRWNIDTMQGFFFFLQRYWFLIFDWSKNICMYICIFLYICVCMCLIVCVYIYVGMCGLPAVGVW